MGCEPKRGLFTICPALSVFGKGGFASDVMFVSLELFVSADGLGVTKVDGVFLGRPRFRAGAATGDL
jgi:hypothetical protein